jgi:hypothetical protein
MSIKITRHLTVVNKKFRSLLIFGQADEALKPLAFHPSRAYPRALHRHESISQPGDKGCHGRFRRVSIRR